MMALPVPLTIGLALLAIALVLAYLRDLRGADWSLPIEFEWNPFSVDSRAAKLERNGRLGEAIRLYADAGHFKQVARSLQNALPGWSVNESLVPGVNELWDLQARLGRLASNQPAVLPKPLAQRFLENTRSASDVFLEGIDRFAAAAGLGANTGDLADSYKRKEQDLSGLRDIIRSARDEVARLVLEGDHRRGLQRVEEEFRRLARATQRARDDLAGPREEAVDGVHTGAGTLQPATSGGREGR